MGRLADTLSCTTNLWRRFATWFDERKVTFFIIFIIGMLTHFELYSNNLVSPDGIWSDLVMYAREWDAQIGRFSWVFSTRFRGGVVSSYMSAVLVCAAISFTSLLLADIWHMKSRVPQILIGSILVCSSLVACALTFPNFGEIYGLHFLFAVIAVYLLVFDLTDGKEQIQVVLATFSLALSLGFYQSSLSIFVFVALSVGIEILLDQSYKRDHFLHFVSRFFVVFILGMLFYYTIAEFYQLLWGTVWSSYQNATSINAMGVLESFPERFLTCYMDFVNFFARKEVIVANHFGARYFNLGILSCALFSIFLAARKVNTLAQKVVLFIFIALIPLSASAIVVIVERSSYVLMTGGLLCVLCYAIARIEKIENFTPVRVFGIVIALALNWGYVLQDFTDYIYMKTVQTQTVALTQRIWMDVEHFEGYIPGETPVIIIGTPAQGNYPLPESDLLWRTSSFARSGIFWNTVRASQEIWPHAALVFLGEGHQINNVSSKYYISLATKYRVIRTMPNYPDPGSMMMFNGMLIVKVSSTDGFAWGY